MRKRRTIKNTAAALAIAITAAFLLPVSALALEPDFEVTDVYADSVYYERLCEVELTGNYQYDIVNVALSQVGYHEGMSKADYHGNSANGYMNFTEYGMVLWGLDKQWCAMFVSWCARQAEIPRAVINTAAQAMTDGIGGERENCFHIAYSSKKYHTPSYGDLIFFNDGIPGNWSHVGLVIDVTEDEVITVEGNKLNGVRIGKYKLDAACIRGYGIYYSYIKAPGAPEIPNICSVTLVSEDSRRGAALDDVEAIYTFNTLYAMDGTRFDIPEDTFIRDGVELFGYHARRDDTGEWYCGERYGWLSESEMLEMGLEPEIMQDGRPWYFEGQWEGLQSVSMFTVWKGEFGLVRTDAELSEEYYAGSDGRLALYNEIYEELWSRSFIATDLADGESAVGMRLGGAE